jgi:hypothetical protein
MEFPLASTPQLRTSKHIFPGGLENTWTPFISFAVPGDVAVVYTIQTGYYWKLGSLLIAFFELAASSVTHSTALGSLIIGGFPFVARTNPTGTLCFSGGNVSWSGITKANYTDAQPLMVANNNYCTIEMSGSGQAGPLSVQPANVTTGQPMTLIGFVQYQTLSET